MLRTRTTAINLEGTSVLHCRLVGDCMYWYACMCTSMHVVCKKMMSFPVLQLLLRRRYGNHIVLRHRVPSLGRGCHSTPPQCHLPVPARDGATSRGTLLYMYMDNRPSRSVLACSSMRSDQIARSSTSISTGRVRGGRRTNSSLALHPV